MQRGYDKEIIIRPGGNVADYWRDIWAYRELFFFLAWRDILVRYKQTVIGVLWCVIKPVITMIVFTLIFGKLAQLPSGGVPYPILVFAALLPWQFFSGALTESSNSLIANSNLLAKVYFPRLIIPVSSVMVNLVDFIISFFIMFGLMVYYHFEPGWRMVSLPLFFMFALFASLGAGLWFAALNVAYRDFRQIIPFMIQFGLFISPVGFSSSIVPDKWRLLYSLNPMVAVIDGFRWAVSDNGQSLYLPGIYMSSAMTFVLFASGVWYFRRVERSFADVI